MRANMDPLAPATSTLAPAIAHIAETAVGLASELDKQSADEPSAERSREARQLRLVQRATTGPDTLKMLVDQGRRDDAVREWEAIQRILERLQAVPGAQQLKLRCEELMQDGEAS